MPCCKVAISKTLRCDKEGCFCLPTDGKPCLCVCENETGDIISCDCECDDNTCKCEKCICINTEGYTCICVCRDEKGSIMTCGGCSCKPESQACDGTASDDACKCYGEECSCKKNACGGLPCSSIASQGNCQCQGNKNSCVCICKNEKGELVCCNDCKCDATNTCNKEGCACVPIESVKDIEGASKNACCCKNTGKSCVCVCKNEKGELVCCNDCKCDATNICNKEGCACVPLECVKDIEGASKNACCCENTGKSFVCVCKNEKGELVCCNDCKCDATNTCNKEGCTCVPIESVKDIEGAFKNACCCENTDKSCVCVCKNEKGELVCCNDCKCDAMNICNKEGCACVPLESVKDIEGASKNACCCENTGKSCVCVCKNEKGELVCCNDCKCDATNTCNKEGCTCVPIESVKDIEGAFKNACCCKNTDKSCVCVCKNEKGELVCCNDCKCDATNTCNKEGCACVPIESVKYIE